MWDEARQFQTKSDKQTLVFNSFEKKGFINILVPELARILKYSQQAGFKYLYASKMSGRKQTYDE